ELMGHLWFGSVLAQQLSGRSLDADLPIERGVVPLIQHPNVHEREIVSAGLNFSSVGDDVQPACWATAHHVDFNSVSGFTVWPNCGCADTIRARPNVDADKSELRDLVLAIEAVDADVLVRNRLAVYFQLHVAVESGAHFNLQARRHRN